MKSKRCLVLLSFGASVTALLCNISAYATTDTSSVSACVASEPKLTPRAREKWCEAVVAATGHDYGVAEQKLEEARAVRHKNAYDNYDIDILTMNLAQQRQDYARALVALESAVKSPLFMSYDIQANRDALYRNGLVLNATQKNWGRAVWYGDHVKAAGPLAPEYSRVLATAYFETGDYVRAEETAQRSVHDASGQVRSDLRNIVLQSRVKQGKETPNIGTALFGEGGLLGALGIEILPNGGNVEQADGDGDDLPNGKGGHGGHGSHQGGGGHGGQHGGGGGNGGHAKQQNQNQDEHHRHGH